MEDKAQSIIEKIKKTESQADKETKMTVLNNRSSMEDKTENHFMELKSKIVNKEYNKVAVAYVDSEVHQAFKHLKDHFGLNVGDLFSYLGENFLEENKEQIIASTKKNKFL